MVHIRVDEIEDEKKSRSNIGGPDSRNGYNEAHAIRNEAVIYLPVRPLFVLKLPSPLIVMSAIVKRIQILRLQSTTDTWLSFESQ